MIMTMKIKFKQLIVSCVMAVFICAAVGPISAEGPKGKKISQADILKKKRAKRAVRKKAVKKAAKKKVRRKAAKKRKKIRRKSAIKMRQKKMAARPKVRRSLHAWLKKLKRRVANSHAKQNKLISVASVRGNKKPDSPPLYWKGKRAEGPVDRPELEEFDRAIDTALNGEKKAAIIQLETFITNHPQSNLIEDAKHTLAMLSPSP